MNRSSEFIIRFAKPGDEKCIHEAHMRSIREVCVKDHGEDEIKGWGNRELGDRWIEAIQTRLVWVVEKENTIFGVGYLRIFAEGEQVGLAYIHALYLTPEVIGLGFGKKILKLMLAEAQTKDVREIKLESSLTAHAFYLGAGFRDTGPMIRLEVGGYPVRAFPMKFTF